MPIVGRRPPARVGMPLEMSSGGAAPALVSAGACGEHGRRGRCGVVVGGGSGAKRRAQERWRRRDREERKIDQVNVRVPTVHKARFKRFGELLREGKKPSEAFRVAFPKGYAALLDEAKRREEHRPADTDKAQAPPAAASAPPGPAKPKSHAQPERQAATSTATGDARRVADAGNRGAPGRPARRVPGAG
jgi:hypothetical protein